MSGIGTKPLLDNAFHESFITRVEVSDWPNDHAFTIWCPFIGKCYRVLAIDVLEYHYMRTGTGRLQGLEEGLPLSNIYVTKEEEFSYWSDRISAFLEKGYDSGEPPICLEFDSHLFANRKRKLLQRDRNIGLLVVCRNVQVTEETSYQGPWPYPHSIPSTD